MKIVNFKLQSVFSDKAHKIFRQERDKLSKILPNADIQHIGSTAILNAITRNDLDLQVRVEKTDFQKAVKELKKLYKVNQLHNWTENYASFKDDKKDMPVDVQLTTIDSEYDKLFQEQQRLLSNNPEVLKEYNKLKLSFEGKDISEYIAARARFFEELETRDLLH